MRRVFLYVCCSLLLISCDVLDPDGNGKPTSFSGNIIFGDTEEPVQGALRIDGLKDDFPSNRSIVGENQKLETDGSFSISFDGNKDIDFYILTIFAVGEDSLSNPIDSYECRRGLNCDRIPPGYNYNDLLITAKRSE